MKLTMTSAAAAATVAAAALAIGAPQVASAVGGDASERDATVTQVDDGDASGTVDDDTAGTDDGDTSKDRDGGDDTDDTDDTDDKAADADDDADDADETDEADGETPEETERAVAMLVAGGLLGAAIGDGLGLPLSRAATPPPPAFSPRRVVARGRSELDDFAERVERELRSLRRLVKRQRRRGWLR